MNNQPIKHRWLLISGIILLGACMRSPFTALPSIINTIAHAFQVPVTNLGILTTIPLLCFGFCSSLVPVIGKRLGNATTILIALIVMLIGATTRVISYPFLLGGTLLIGLAITVINVLIPAIVTEYLPKQIGLMTSLYGATATLFSALFAYLITPLSHGLGWQGAILSMAVLILLTLIIWLPNLRKPANEVNSTNQITTTTNVWRQRSAWGLVCYMGSSSIAFYVTVAWLPTIAQARGLNVTGASLLASLFQLASVPVAFIIPIWASRMQNRSRLVSGAAFITILGFIGLSLPIKNQLFLVIVAILLGCGTAASFSLNMAFFGLKTRSFQTTRALSGMVQSLGYLIAATGPILTGQFKQITGTWQASLIFVSIVVLIGAIAGCLAERRAYLED